VPGPIRHAGKVTERPPAGSGAAEGRLPPRFARSAASNYALTGVLLVVALVTTPILTRHLGAEGYGIWIFVGSAITYVQLLDLGFGGAVVAAVARLSARGDEDGLEQTLNSSFFVLAALGLVAFAVCVVAAQFVPGALHLDPPLAATTRDLLLILGLDVAVSIPMDTFGCGLVALQRYDLLNATLIGVALCQAVAWTAVLVFGGGLLGLGVVTVCISLVGQFARYVLLRRLLPTLSISPLRVQRAIVRSLVSPAGWYALGDCLDNFRDEASVLVLGMVQNVASAGVFAVGEKLATLGTQMGTPVTEPFFPHAAALAGRGDRAELSRAARIGARVAAGATIPCCLVVAIFARSALFVWVGPAFERAAPAVVILAVAFALQSFVGAPIKLVSGSGGQRLVASLGMAKVGVQVVLTAVLGIALGVTGVALAVLASVLAVEMLVTLPLACRTLGTRVSHVVMPIVRGHLPSLVVSGSLGWFVLRGPVSSFAHSHGRFAGIAVVGVGGLVVLVPYLVLFALFGLDRAARHQAMAWLRRTRHVRGRDVAAVATTTASVDGTGSTNAPRDSTTVWDEAARAGDHSRAEREPEREPERDRTMTIAVVVPVRDGSALVGRCVQACRDQSRPPDEVIVVDNGSSDDTAAVAVGAGASVLSEPVRGSYRARNRGWRSTSAEIIAFTDGDCIPDPNWLAQLVEPFRDRTVAAVGGAIVQAELASASQRWMVERRFLDQAQNAAHEFLPFFATANVAYRRSVLEALDGFDEAFLSGGDCDMSWRVQALGAGRLVYRPEAEVEHRVGPRLAEVTERWYRYEAEHILLERRWSDWPGHPAAEGFFKRTRRLWLMPAALGYRAWTGRPLSVPLIDAAVAVSRERGRVRGRIDARHATIGPMHFDARLLDAERDGRRDPALR
jgi:O-antigen/teichoic acid export membrane protein/GT2 family glycosyltransferase